MKRPDLVLDTNALTDLDFLYWLRSYPGRKIIPAVAYTELGIHWEAKGFLPRLQSFLAQHGIEVEWFRRQEADLAIQSAVRVGDFAENARDHLIGSHAAAPGRILVTNNTKDFTFLTAVRRPRQLQDEYR